jgi:hypothetical protein
MQLQELELEEQRVVEQETERLAQRREESKVSVRFTHRY